MPEEHAKYSPSSLAYREICAGFINRNESGPAAEEGTLLHKAVETEKLDGLNEEQRQCAEMCLQFVAGEEAAFRPEQILSEQRLSICEGLTFGTADRIAIAGKRALLFDYKFGRNSVPDAEENPQLQAYAIGVFEKFPKVEEVRVFILLPRRDEICWAVYQRKDLSRLQLRVQTIIARCEVPEPELRPTDHCLYCAAQGICPALHKHALTIAAGYEDEIQLPDEFQPSKIADPSTMSRALSVARVMEKWCESVKHHALQMRLGGHEIPGHELRSRSGTRKIVDPLAAWLAVKDRMTPDQFIGCTEVSLSKLETTFAEATPRGGKAKAKQELCEALADLGIVETGKESFYLAKTRK